MGFNSGFKGLKNKNGNTKTRQSWLRVYNLTPHSTMFSDISTTLQILLLCNSPASEFYMPTFRNTLSVPPS